MLLYLPKLLHSRSCSNFNHIQLHIHVIRRYYTKKVTRFPATVKLPGEKFAHHGRATEESSTSAESITATEPKKFILNSAEELFAELRDKNFNAVGPLLSRKAKLIAAQFDVSGYSIQ